MQQPSGMRMERSPNSLWKTLLACLAMLTPSYNALAQNSSTVAVPHYDDKYSNLVRQLESGQTNINYHEFRDSFLESERFKVASREKQNLDNLRKTMHDLMKNSQYADIVDVTKKMLSLDYTDMEAHKILQQTYKILRDTPN